MMVHFGWFSFRSDLEPGLSLAYGLLSFGARGAGDGLNNRLDRPPRLAIPMSECLLIAVGSSKAAVPSTANPSHQRNVRFSRRLTESEPAEIHPKRSYPHWGIPQ